MVRRPYVASGKMEDGAAFKMLAAALGAGALLGAIEGVVAQWFDLLIVFPAAIGLAAGFVVATVVEKNHVRAPLVAGLLAALGGAAGQAAKHEVEYQRFLHSDALAALPGDGPGVDDLLRAATGKRGRAGYFALRSQHGTSISRHGRKAATLTGTGFWLLFGGEFLLAAGLAATVAGAAAGAPYCERCKKWYQRDLPLASGSGDKETVKAALLALAASDWKRVADQLGTPGGDTASLFLIAACPGCTDNDRRLTVKVVHRPGHRKEKSTTRFMSMIRPDELRGLESALAERKPAPPVS